MLTTNDYINQDFYPSTSYNGYVQKNYKFQNVEFQNEEIEGASPPEVTAIEAPLSDYKIYKSLPRNKCPSKCLVCRNPAIGYHYDVPSCNGCKTFFRRTIITGRKFTCTKNKKCMEGEDPIDMSKRLCRACRFAKCVDSGMNPMAIQAEVQNEEGEMLKKEVISKRQSTGIVSSLMVTEEDLLSRMIEKLSLVEAKIEPLHRSGLPPGYRDARLLEEILDSKPVFNVNDIPNLTFYPPPLDKNGQPRHGCTNYVHSSFLASVESSKLFDFSSQLNLESRMTLMKHATVICSNMMNAFFSIHEMKSDFLIHPNGIRSGHLRKRDRDSNAFSNSHVQLLQKTLIAFLSNKVDKIEYLLFKAIMLCNPAVPGLSHFDQQIIEKERNQFVKALLNYCLLQHGTIHGPARFATIISLAPIIEGQSKGQKDFHVYIKAKHFHKHKSMSDRGRKCVSGMFDQIMDT